MTPDESPAQTTRASGPRPKSEHCGFCKLGRMNAGTDYERDCPYCDGTGYVQEVGR